MTKDGTCVTTCSIEECRELGISVFHIFGVSVEKLFRRKGIFNRVDFGNIENICDKTAYYTAASREEDIELLKQTVNADKYVTVHMDKTAMQNPNLFQIDGDSYEFMCPDEFFRR